MAHYNKLINCLTDICYPGIAGLIMEMWYTARNPGAGTKRFLFLMCLDRYYKYRKSIKDVHAHTNVLYEYVHTIDEWKTFPPWKYRVHPRVLWSHKSWYFIEKKPKGKKLCIQSIFLLKEGKLLQKFQNFKCLKLFKCEQIKFMRKYLKYKYIYYLQ